MVLQTVEDQGVSEIKNLFEYGFAEGEIGYTVGKPHSLPTHVAVCPVLYVQIDIFYIGRLFCFVFAGLPFLYAVHGLAWF